MLAGLNLTNNLFGLMLIYPTSTIPYAVWILTPYIKTIPTELEEAAYVDGCSKLVSMIRIVFPLSLPGIITTFVFSFTICWGEYLYALVSMIQENSKTMPLIISGLIWGDMYPWQQIMAGGIIACGPIILIYMFASKYLISGLTAGGIKM
jgi:multiple sugar transport system permease protein